MRQLSFAFLAIMLSVAVPAQAEAPVTEPDRLVAYVIGDLGSWSTDATRRDGKWRVQFKTTLNVDSLDPDGPVKVQSEKDFELSADASARMTALVSDLRLYETRPARRCTDVGGRVQLRFEGRALDDTYCNLRDFTRSVESLLRAESAKVK